MSRLTSVWEGLGKPFSPDELGALRKNMEDALAAGYRLSPQARAVLEYESKPPPDVGLSYRIRIADETIADRYKHWLALRKPPIFGAYPDAKVMDLARELGEPTQAPVIDIGAGTGRNAVPLAKRGHSVRAIEIVPALVDEMRRSAEAEGSALEIEEADIFAPECELKRAHYKLAILTEVVATHVRDISRVRRLFEKLADALEPGGLVLFDVFLPVEGYKPDPTIREISHAVWSCLFTRGELQFIHTELPFERVSDESEHDYERDHLPPEAWPPTSWFAEWSQGLNLFDVRPGKSPVELRWLVYRRR